MEDCKPNPGVLDGEQHVIAAAHHLVKALQATTNLSDDLRRLLTDLEVHLSATTRLHEGEEESYGEIENKLMSAQHTIKTLHSDHSKIWDSGPPVFLGYLRAVEEIQSLTASLEDMPLHKSRKIKQLLDRAQIVLEMAMSRLQNELTDILVQNRQCFEQEYGPGPENEEIHVYEESVVSNEDDSVENVSQRVSSSTEISEEYVMDLIHPDVIPQIKSIADIMFASGYEHEFCQAFTGFWRDTLAEYLTVHDMEQFSIEDVLQMEWKLLNSRIRKWRRAIKGLIGIYLASTKRLFDQVLGEHRAHITSTCLIEASKGPLFCLLNFGQAMSIGPHQPEWLYCLLDMYEVLKALVPDVDALFPQETGSMARIEFHELLTRLGDSIKAIFTDLGNHIASCSSTTAYPNGGIPHLTKYVMNYILYSAEYIDTLNLLLEDTDLGPKDLSSPLTTYLQSLTSALEANLDKRSNLYKDSSLKHIFMMNSIHYMVQKIRNSKLSTYFGDDWIKAHVVKFRYHARCYERVTWSCILDLLRNDSKAGKATLKERSRGFAGVFEDLYKNQTRWCVPDNQLREEIRISASKTVIPAYRSFVSNVTDSIGEKYLKYTEQDLETYILDLLEGSSKSVKRR